MNNADVKKRLMKNEAFAKAYKEAVVSQEIAERIIKARAAMGLSQAQLAMRTGTKQPSIARLESGEHLPSLSFLARVAEQLDLQLNTQILLGKPKQQPSWSLGKDIGMRGVFRIVTEKGVKSYARS